MSELAAIDQAMVEMQAELSPLAADAALAESRADGDMSWLPEWYLRKLAEVEAAEAAIKEHTQALLRQCGARRKALEWKWGREVNVQVDKDLRAQGGPKRSVRYATGVAGYRAVGGKDRVVVVDEERAMAAAAKSCKDAIKVERTLLTSILLEHLKKTGEALPGTKLESTPREDRFYAGKTVLELPADPQPQGALP